MREKGRKRIFFKIMIKNFSRFDKRYEYEHPRSSIGSKLDELRDILSCFINLCTVFFMTFLYHTPPHFQFDSTFLPPFSPLLGPSLKIRLGQYSQFREVPLGQLKLT